MVASRNSRCHQEEAPHNKSGIQSPRKPTTALRTASEREQGGLSLPAHCPSRHSPEFHSAEWTHSTGTIPEWPRGVNPHRRHYTNARARAKPASTSRAEGVGFKKINVISSTCLNSKLFPACAASHAARGTRIADSTFLHITRSSEFTSSLLQWHAARCSSSQPSRQSVGATWSTESANWSRQTRRRAIPNTCRTGFFSRATSEGWEEKKSWRKKASMPPNHHSLPFAGAGRGYGWAQGAPAAQGRSSGALGLAPDPFASAQPAAPTARRGKRPSHEALCRGF